VQQLCQRTLEAREEAELAFGPSIWLTSYSVSASPNAADGSLGPDRQALLMTKDIYFGVRSVRCCRGRIRNADANSVFFFGSGAPRPGELAWI